MKSFATSHEDPADSPPLGKVDDEKGAAILQELDNILQSRFFRSAGRSRQFLRFVVEHKLAGHPELLKERTIGVEVFERSPDYATGDDPVVRVQAGEVRRRLEQYYQALPSTSTVRIELPLGSYSPAFQWPLAAAASPTPSLGAQSPNSVSSPKKRQAQSWIILSVCAVLSLGAGIGYLSLHRSIHLASVLEQFWSPAFATQQPLLICLQNGIAYRPNPALYEKYTRLHPGTFQTEAQRANDPLPLDGNEKIAWNEMHNLPENGIAKGDLLTSVKLAVLFGKIGKSIQVRVGDDYQYKDLRNSPAVLVGAFNNKWTMEQTADLHFAFVEEDGKFLIKEKMPGSRVWNRTISTDEAGHPKSFAIVSRLLDSKTGEFTVIVAGIQGWGTEAATDFVSNSEYLEKGLRDAPPNWQTKNLQVVLETTVIDSVPGPPRVDASYVW